MCKLSGKLSGKPNIYRLQIIFYIILFICCIIFLTRTQINHFFKLILFYNYVIILLGDTYMAQSKRYTTTREEREQMVINKSNPTNSSKSKLTEYLSQPNVKKYNSIVTSKSFEIVASRGYPRAFDSYEECLEEVEDYFKLCYECNIIPTIASLSLYLGLNRETLYNYANSPKIYDYSNILRNAINVCQSYQETAVLDGSVPSVPFIFLAKNYYGLKDTTDISVNSNNQNDTTLNNNTMQIIKEQIENEKSTQLLEHKD